LRDFGSKEIEEALRELGYSEKARPEELSLEAFLSLYEKIKCQ